MATPENQPTSTQLEYMLKFRRLDAVSNILGLIVRWGSAVWMTRYGYLSITSLAGHETIAHIVIQFLGSLTVSKYVAYLFGVSGIIYGYGERRLRQRNIGHLAESKNNLERLLDPNRTSSKITKTGTTPPGEKKR